MCVCRGCGVGYESDRCDKCTASIMSNKNVRHLLKDKLSNRPIIIVNYSQEHVSFGAHLARTLGGL